MQNNTGLVAYYKNPVEVERYRKNMEDAVGLFIAEPTELRRKSLAAYCQAYEFLVAALVSGDYCPTHRCHVDACVEASHDVPVIE